MFFPVLAFAALIGPTQSVSVRDWNQWRGPTRDGVVPASSAPTAWPQSFKQAWRLDVGEGYSSPVVSGNRVFVHSRKGDREVVTAVNPKDGKVFWQLDYTAPFQRNQYASKMQSGPFATPLAAGDSLFTLGATGMVNAWDAATGRPLWTRDFSTSVDSSKLFCGTAASPLMVGGLVVFQIGSDVHGGQIVGLDPASGASKWEWKGPGPGYPSPILIAIGGTQQIVTMTQQSILGLASDTGRELWSIPFPDEWQENIVTPLWTGSLLIVSGTRQGTHAYSLSQVGGKWQPVQAWKVTEVAMYISTPVFGDGTVYGHSNKQRGQFVALDPKTGATRWKSEGRQRDHASVLLTPKHILYLTNAGELIAVRRDPAKFELERRYKLAESETYASPALVGSNILVRDATGIAMVSPGK